MKLRKRLLSLVLSLSMMGCVVPFNAMAEDAETDTFEAKLSPDNYASIYLQKGSAKTEAGGYNGTDRDLLMYYNTLFDDNTHIYMHSGSILSEYSNSKGLC